MIFKYKNWKESWESHNSTITICVPAYNASSFITKTLDSIVHQKYTKFNCIISIDHSSDDTFEKVKPFLKDPRFKVFRQKKRLGWSGNTNFVFRQARSKYVCLVPHDDILDPKYISELLPIIIKNKSAAVVYSDIKSFSMEQDIVMSQDSISGNWKDRVVEFLNFHHAAIHYRGIVNRQLVGNLLYSNSNELKDFSEDTILGLQWVLKGDFIRHPEVLYYKRYLKSSYHHSWQNWSTSEKIRAWKLHIKRCLEILSQQPQYEEYEKDIKDALKNRLIQSNSDLWYRNELNKHPIELNISREELLDK